MKKHFNIFFEPDSAIFNGIIKQTINQGNKGYVCIIDGNVLAHATKSILYRKIINGAIVNSCDGSSIALLIRLIHKQKFNTYTGPEIFCEYVKRPYRQCFLGNTPETLEHLQVQFLKLGYDMKLFHFEPLDFREVDDFDYKAIAHSINRFSPDVVWVSLGAPKQELFISKLFPEINKGVLFGIGAAINLFLGEHQGIRAPKIMRELHLEWLFRVIKEPKRVGRRAVEYLLLLPRLVLEEIKAKSQNRI